MKPPSSMELLDCTPRLPPPYRVPSAPGSCICRCCGPPSSPRCLTPLVIAALVNPISPASPQGLPGPAHSQCSRSRRAGEGGLMSHDLETVCADRVRPPSPSGVIQRPSPQLLCLLQLGLTVLWETENKINSIESAAGPRQLRVSPPGPTYPHTRVHTHTQNLPCLSTPCRVTPRLHSPMCKPLILWAPGPRRSFMPRPTAVPGASSAFSPPSLATVW